jgi:hypothetical protein
MFLRQMPPRQGRPHYVKFQIRSQGCVLRELREGSLDYLQAFAEAGPVLPAGETDPIGGQDGK